MTKKQTKQEEMQSGVDLIWNGWLNTFQTYDALQQEAEESSLKLLEKQKELIEKTQGTFEKIEKDLEKATADWKANLEKVMPAQANPVMSNWLNFMEDARDKTKALAWQPSNPMLDYFTKAQEQFGEQYKNALKAQQKGRKEVVESLETLTEKMKETHKSLLQSIEK